MTTFLAMLVAAAAGLLLRDPLDGIFGVGLGEALGFAAGVFIYYYARRILRELRDE
jgi:hypothetical protein